MFHIELRQFPHNAWRFNLSEGELFAAVLEPWLRDQWIELSERKWKADQARLTVLEGPSLAVQQLSMGRGWRNAERESTDVTEQVMAQARARVASAGAQAHALAGPGPGPGGASPLAGGQAAGVQEEVRRALIMLLGNDPEALLQAWQLAAGRRPELSPSECLALAERTLRSLG